MGITMSMITRAVIVVLGVAVRMNAVRLQVLVRADRQISVSGWLRGMDA